MSTLLIPFGTLTIDFKALLRTAASRFPSQQAMSSALGMSTARLNRALNKGDYPFNVQNCLRLARLTGESPSAILRAAGKGEIADLIESLYGEVDSTVTMAERDHLTDWRRLSSATQASIALLMRELLPTEATASTKRRRPA